MSGVSRAADFAYTIRFLKLLVTQWEDTNAYKLGLIDEKGQRIKSKRVETSEEKSAYNSFHRLVFNLKKLIEKVPGGGAKISSYVAALFLLKEKYNLSDKSVDKVIARSKFDDELDLLSEQTSWFVVKNKQLSPGIYKITENKLINTTYEELVKKHDKIRVPDDCFPVDNFLGYDIYEVTHVKSGQPLYVTVGELLK